MDPQKTINEVVDSVKSEGLFDQFRKECLEEFENMETYHQLKQRVENHVTSFLSKHRYHDGLQKNPLRTNLRNYISKSDVLLNSIQQLVDEVLSLKGHSFCLRIDKQVDRHLSKDVPQHSVGEKASDNDSSGKCEQSGSSTVDTTGSSSKENIANQNELSGKREVASNQLNMAAEFSEMTEIEEVEMEISESQECVLATRCDDSQIINNEDPNEIFSDESVVYAISKEHQTKAGDSENSCNLGDHFSSNNTPSNDDSSQNEDKNVAVLPSTSIESENTVSVDIDVNDDSSETDEDAVDERSENESIDDVSVDSTKNRDLDLPPIVTEPISDDSNSNDSSYRENIKSEDISSSHELPKKEEAEIRRKSSRVRTLPLKFREEVDPVKKRTDDTDSVSSNDIDYKEGDDNNQHIKFNKRGRPRKRPLSAGRNERSTSRNKRHSSLSSSNMKMLKRKHRTSSTEREEDARKFGTKKEMKKSDVTKAAASRSSGIKKSRDSDSIISDEGLSAKCDDDDYSLNRNRRKSESREDSRKGIDRNDKPVWKKNDHKIKREINEEEMGSFHNKRDRVESHEDNMKEKGDSDWKQKSKRDHRSELREGSSKEDGSRNYRKSRNTKSSSPERKSSEKDNDDRKNRDRRSESVDENYSKAENRFYGRKRDEKSKSRERDFKEYDRTHGKSDGKSDSRKSKSKEDRGDEKGLENREFHKKERSEKSNSKERSEKSNSKERSAKSNSKERSEKSKSKERSEKSNSKERSEKSNSKERSEKSNSKERSEKSNSKERSEKSNSKERSEKSNSKERSEKSNSKESSEKSNSKERGEKSNSKERTFSGSKDSSRTNHTDKNSSTDIRERNSSTKSDSDKDSRKQRDDKNSYIEKGDSVRGDYGHNKRIHSPSASVADTNVKRSKRSIKQRQRYSP